MIMRKTALILFYTCIALNICAFPPLVLGETSCLRADRLFKNSQSQSDPAAEKTILEEVLMLCPQHARAWNNLGWIYEKEGQLVKAEEAYRRSLELKPDLGVPLAGLGDIAMARGRFQEAVGWYEKFLAFLSAEMQNGDSLGFGAYEDEYRLKLEQAKLRWQIHEGSMTTVISKTTLTRGLRRIIVRPKGSKPTGPERLSLCIHFNFDSAELKPLGRAQLMEVARAMLSDELSAEMFLIEGHSDTIGTANYNFELSRQRADKVRAFLISQGVGVRRLTTKSCGESRPIVPAGSKQKQAINRRVEFVKIIP